MNSLRFVVCCLQLKARVGFQLSLFVLMMLMSFFSSAQLSLNPQPYRAETRKGNKEFTKGNYTDAEADYKKALDKKNNMPEATFNLGDAVYQQKRYEEAVKQFQLSAQTNPDPKVKSKAYHNLGNAHMEQQKWEDAVKAYKNSLKLNPRDSETKYNLAYANEKLRQQKQQGGGGQNDKKQDQKQDKKEDQKQDQNKGDQKQDQQQAKNDKQQQQKQGQQPQPKLSKEEAEKLMQALMNEEQKTNQKMQQKQAKAVNIKIQKDW